MFKWGLGSSGFGQRISVARFSLPLTVLTHFRFELCYVFKTGRSKICYIEYSVINL